MVDKTLRQASYQGVPFFFESIERDDGRRLSVNDLPFQEQAYIQDMGKNNQRLKVNLYVIGDSSIEEAHRSAKERADLLCAVLNAEGIGTLELPYFPDRLKVRAGAYQASYGGQSKVDFSCEFIVTEEQVPIFTVTQRLEKSNFLLDNFINALYRDIFRITNFVDDVVDGVALVLNAPYMLRSWEFVLKNALGFVKSLFQNIELENDNDKRNIKKRIETLETSTSLDFKPYFEVLKDIAQAPKLGSPINAFEGALNYQPTTITYPMRSETLQQSALAETTLSHAFKQAFIACYAVSLGQQTFQTRSQAIYHRALLSDELDLEYDHVLGESFEKLTDLTNNTASYITENISTLVPVVTIEGHTKFMPATWWSYRLYGNLDYVQDLIERNNIADPSFMPLSFRAVAWE